MLIKVVSESKDKREVALCTTKSPDAADADAVCTGKNLYKQEAQNKY